MFVIFGCVKQKTMYFESCDFWDKNKIYHMKKYLDNTYSCCCVKKLRNKCFYK